MRHEAHNDTDISAASSRFACGDLDGLGHPVLSTAGTIQQAALSFATDSDSPIDTTDLQRGGLGNLEQAHITAPALSFGGTQETLSDVGGTGSSNRGEYKAWVGMKQRCFNSHHARYDDYGGRGITVCPEWRDDFPAFLRDMGSKPSPRHTLERIDNDGPYAPGNCRWDSYHAQTRNRRSNVLLTHGGVTLCLNDWADRIGIGRMTLTQRLRRGWPIAQALSLPARRIIGGRKI